MSVLFFACIAAFAIAAAGEEAKKPAGSDLATVG
jgi:hypothetical protein